MRTFAEKTLGEISDFYFSRNGCSAAKREKKELFLELICTLYCRSAHVVLSLSLCKVNFSSTAKILNL